jgi:hypothetical protein
MTKWRLSFRERTDTEAISPLLTVRNIGTLEALVALEEQLDERLYLKMTKQNGYKNGILPAEWYCYSLLHSVVLSVSTLLSPLASICLWAAGGVLRC